MNAKADVRVSEQVRFCEKRRHEAVSCNKVLRADSIDVVTGKSEWVINARCPFQSLCKRAAQYICKKSLVTAYLNC